MPRFIRCYQEGFDKPRQLIKKQKHYFVNKGLQNYGFSGSHVQMWVLDHKEGWMLENWCFQTMVLEKTLESPLDCQEIQPLNIKRNQPWIIIGEIDSEAPILWPPEVKNSLLEKTLVLGKNEAGGEGDDRGWDDWMASPTQWTWVWANSRN